MAAAKTLESGSAPGVDGMPPEIYKRGGPDLWGVLHDSFVEHGEPHNTGLVQR
eukprot:CAMPEP_0184503566 /NCGR_PEP_ID=MMETSP0113_2-20130426/51970_1 /TAXON_ID=91329 /ORGANISM="Norrisiella sphaerica, Strain BC52" /LENGTH=52 /DNA_ID=CAMNT_0026893091 /DNA_START=1681 /DNA_END=1839 /DNA_ORIENTATION=-